MRDFSCEISTTFCIVAVLLSQFVIEAQRQCSISSLSEDESCGLLERCVAKANNDTGICDCLINYQRQKDGKCVPHPTTVEPTSTESLIDSTAIKQDSQQSSSGGSVVAGLLIPLFLISLAAVVFFSARRYKWVQRFRMYQQNRYGNVLVTRDDDDDDPPIV